VSRSPEREASPPGVAPGPRRVRKRHASGGTPPVLASSPERHSRIGASFWPQPIVPLFLKAAFYARVGVDSLGEGVFTAARLIRLGSPILSAAAAAGARDGVRSGKIES